MRPVFTVHTRRIKVAFSLTFASPNSIRKTILQAPPTVSVHLTIMFFKGILPIFAAAAIAAALPQQSEVDQWTYPQFPENGASCPGWPGEAPSIWTFAQLKELAIEASKAPQYSDSAANHGGSCAFSSGIPMHIVSYIPPSQFQLWFLLNNISLQNYSRKKSAN